MLDDITNVYLLVACRTFLAESFSIVQDLGLSLSSFLRCILIAVSFPLTRMQVNGPKQLANEVHVFSNPTISQTSSDLIFLSTAGQWYLNIHKMVMQYHDGPFFCKN